MSSIWIILLDVSGSMASGFSAKPTSDPLAERGAWHSKLEAAKDLLARQIAVLRVQDVSIISFADRAEKIFHGPRSEFSRAKSAIDALKADGETNLAEALATVTDEPGFEQYKAVSVLILSDGLANVGDPVAAATRLIAKYPFARIDTILIDETPEGRQIAESVSINGSVRPAFSSMQLGDAVVSARASALQNELASFAPRRLEIETELSQIANIASPTLVTVTSLEELNATSLRNEIVPTLEGLEILEHAYSDASGVPYQGAIRSISQSSPISISFAGLREAVEIALEWVIPWRRENAQKIAALKVRQAELENLSLEARVAKERAEAESARAKNRQMEVDLVSSKFALAERILDSLDPDRLLSIARRQKILKDLVNGIDRMSEASMEFKPDGPSTLLASSQLTRPT